MTINRRLFLSSTFSIILFNCTNFDHSIIGNWKSIESNGESKIHTEVYIDDKTFNVFSEEINDIIFSNYYGANNKKIFILNNEKTDTLVEFEYEIHGGTLKLSGSNTSTKYFRIKNGNTLDEFINDSISKHQYLENFHQRKNKND